MIELQIFLQISMSRKWNLVVSFSFLRSRLNKSIFDIECCQQCCELFYDVYIDQCNRVGDRLLQICFILVCNDSCERCVGNRYRMVYALVKVCKYSCKRSVGDRCFAVQAMKYHCLQLECRDLCVMLSDSYTDLLQSLLSGETW